MATSIHLKLAVLGTLIALASGCAQQGLEKVAVSGMVQYAGKPIPHGQIRFFPIEGTRGPVSGGVIKDGKYRADGKGGVPLGKHRVEIYAYRPMRSAVSAAIQAEGGASEQYLPAKYNGASGLQIVITGESSSQPVDFDLAS